MKKVRYLFIPAKGIPELLLHDQEWNIKEDLRNECTEYVDYRYLGRNLYLYFDDLGIKQFLNNKLIYNRSLPDSNGFANMLFGNVVVEKVDEAGNSIDMTIEDFDYVFKNTFVISDQEVIKNIEKIILHFGRIK